MLKLKEEILTAGGAGSGGGAAPGTGGNTATTGCASGSRAACASLIIHAMASLPLARKKDGDDLDAKIDGWVSVAGFFYHKTKSWMEIKDLLRDDCYYIASKNYLSGHPRIKLMITRSVSACHCHVIADVWQKNTMA